MEILDLRARMVQRAFTAIESPLVTGLMNDERVMTLLLTMMSAPAKTRAAARALGELMARTFGLATAADLRQLEADLVERLGDELDPLERGDPHESD